MRKSSYELLVDVTV